MPARGPLHGPLNLRLNFEGARQASSPSLCASVRTVPRADEAEQQLSTLALSPCELSADVRIFRAGLPEPHLHLFQNLRLKFDGARQASSPSLCASVRAVPWADEAEQQLSRLAPSGCQLSADIRIFKAGLPETPDKDPLSKFEVLRGREAITPSLCASVRAVLWEDEAEQQLSRLARSECELSADVHIFRAGLTEVPCTDKLRYV